MPRPKKPIVVEEPDIFDPAEIFGFNELEFVVDEEVFENPNVKPVTTEPIKRAVVSFNTPIELNEIELAPKAPKKKQFVRKEIVIDKFNSKRTRVELTPSVCDICAFDIAAKHFGTWHQVPLEQQPIVIKALQKHKEVAHTTADKHIITEDEIPTKWLGGGKL